MCPLRVEMKLLPLLLWFRDGDEIGTGSTAVNDLIRDPLVGKSEMAGWLVERRVDDRIFNDDLAHLVVSKQWRGNSPFSTFSSAG